MVNTMTIATKASESSDIWIGFHIVSFVLFCFKGISVSVIRNDVIKDFGQNAKNGSEMSVPGWKVFLSHGTVISDI